MAPATTAVAPVEAHHCDNCDLPCCGKCDNQESDKFTSQIQWLDFVAISYVHLACIYGLYLLITAGSIKTFLWLFFSVYSSGIGITAGVHRLWSHRAYKANWPLRLLLAILFTISGQRHVYAWALDHRVHHKYSETDSDPHDARRGFWFAHVGWLFLTPHPAVVRRRKQVDMSDLEADSIVMWQKKYYIPLFAIFTVALPAVIPILVWGEDPWLSLWVHFNVRFCTTLNIAFCVNSVAHMWGNRPYDKSISPSENLGVTIAALGEGFHNYHHVFPFDYKTGELGDYTLNLTTGFIDFFAKIGWATDLKSVSPDMIKRRMQRTGDGSTGQDIWGWGDKDYAVSLKTSDFKED